MLPVPQREIALVLGEPRKAVLSLLRLRRARHGGRFSHAVREARVPRRGGGSRRARGPGDAARGAGRRRARQRRSVRGHGPRRAVLRAEPGGRSSGRGDYLAQRGIDAPTSAKFALGIRARLLECTAQSLRNPRGRAPPPAAGGTDHRARHARRPGPGRLLRPLSRPPDVSDPRFARSGARLRRPSHRSRRAEIPQFAGNPAVPQGTRTVRSVRGATGAHGLSGA